MNYCVNCNHNGGEWRKLELGYKWICPDCGCGIFSEESTFKPIRKLVIRSRFSNKTTICYNRLRKNPKAIMLVPCEAQVPLDVKGKADRRIFSINSNSWKGLDFNEIIIDNIDMIGAEKLKDFFKWVKTDSLLLTITNTSLPRFLADTLDCELDIL